MIARLAAAMLAVRQGRWTEAEGHLARAEELYGKRPACCSTGSTRSGPSLPWLSVTPDAPSQRQWPAWNEGAVPISSSG